MSEENVSGTNVDMSLDETDDAVGGGFEGIPDLPGEPDKDEPNVALDDDQDSDEEVKSEDESEPEAKADEEAKEEDDTDKGDEGEKKEEEPDKDEGQPEPDLVKTLQEKIDQQNQQMVNLTALVNQMRQDAKPPEPPEPEEDEPPLPSDEEWELDPKSAIKKMDARRDWQSRKEAKEQEAVRQTNETLIAKQRESFASAVNLDASLGEEGSEVRSAAERIFYNPENNLQNSSMGPLLAGLSALVLTGKYVPAGSNNNPANDTEKATEAARESGAADERARQDRVRKGAMHGSGKGGKSSKVALAKLSKEEHDTARMLGVSDEAYAAAKATLNG